MPQDSKRKRRERRLKRSSTKAWQLTRLAVNQRDEARALAQRLFKTLHEERHPTPQEGEQ